MDRYKLHKNALKEDEYIVYDEVDNYVVFNGTLTECTQYINDNIERIYNDDIEFMHNITEE